MKNKITLIIKKSGRRPEAKSLERTEKKQATLSAKKNSTYCTTTKNRGYFTFLPPPSFFFPKTCMLVMSMVPIYLPLFKFTNHHYSIALACTETSCCFFVLNRQKKSLKRTPAVGVMLMQKLRSLCWEHSCESFFPLKPWVGQNTATHASPAAWNFLLILVSTLLVHSPTLLFSTAYILNCINCG